MDKKPYSAGFELNIIDILATPSSEPEPDSVATAKGNLATKEQGSQRCQVCDFPAIAGHVQGEIDKERYSLQICPGCLQHAVLCLRDSYRQNRLFDDLEIEELVDFGKEKGTLGEAVEAE